ncbi:hypothetical protein HDU97_004836 [Phlyctochytrium planicorne]|nr:hypothetical protein HDU97_004836 [Phlyctochytrium planicorne]
MPPADPNHHLPTPPQTSTNNPSSSTSTSATTSRHHPTLVTPSSASSLRSEKAAIPQPPKYFNDTIFKIKAVEGYIAATSEHVSFRKGQYFYALSYNDDTECYFVSTQYATPFARTAVCGFVPERFFETVSLNGKDPPHPTPSQVKKKKETEQHQPQPQQERTKPSKAGSTGNIAQGESSTLSRLRSSKSVGNLRDPDEKDEGVADDSDERISRRDDPRHEGPSALGAKVLSGSSTQKEQKSRGRSLSMRSLRRRGKSNPPAPEQQQQEVEEQEVDVAAQKNAETQQTAGIVIPPRRTFIPNLMASSTSTKPGTSSKKRQQPKAFQNLDKSFRLFNFSTWSERPPQTSKTPGAPTTAAATSTHLRHETPISSNAMSPLSMPSVSHPQAPAGMGKPLPLPPMPNAYAEAVKQQQQQQQNQNQLQQQQQQSQLSPPHPTSITSSRPTSPSTDVVSATIVEALKQSGNINLTRFVIAVTTRSPNGAQRVSNATKSFEEFIQFHASLLSRTSNMRRPSNEVAFYAAAASAQNGRSPPASPTAGGGLLHNLPELPQPISNVAELRRRFLLDARLQSQMTDLNAYMGQLLKISAVTSRALEVFLLSPSGEDEGVSMNPPRAATPPYERSEDGHFQQMTPPQQGVLKARMRSKSEAPFFGAAKETTSPTQERPGIFAATLSTLRRSKSRTRMDNQQSLSTPNVRAGYYEGEMSPPSTSANPLNKIMTVLRNGGGANTPSARERSAHIDDGGSPYQVATPQLARSAAIAAAAGGGEGSAYLMGGQPQQQYAIQTQQQRGNFLSPTVGSLSASNSGTPIMSSSLSTPNLNSASQQPRIGLGGGPGSSKGVSSPYITPRTAASGLNLSSSYSSNYGFQPPSPPSPIAQNFVSEVMASAGMDHEGQYGIPKTSTLPNPSSSFSSLNRPRPSQPQVQPQPQPMTTTPSYSSQQLASALQSSSIDVEEQSQQGPPPPPSSLMTGWGRMMARLGVADSSPATSGGGSSSVSIRQRSTSLGWDASGGPPPPPTSSQQQQLLQQQQQQQLQQMQQQQQQGYPDKATVKMMMAAAAAASGNVAHSNVSPTGVRRKMTGGRI